MAAGSSGSQSCKRPNAFFSCVVDIIHVGVIPPLHLAKQSWQGGILIEHRKRLLMLASVMVPKLQHLLYQCTGFYRIVGIHLLKG